MKLRKLVIEPTFQLLRLPYEQVLTADNKKKLIPRFDMLAPTTAELAYFPAGVTTLSINEASVSRPRYNLFVAERKHQLQTKQPYSDASWLARCQRHGCAGPFTGHRAISAMQTEGRNVNLTTYNRSSSGMEIFGERSTPFGPASGWSESSRAAYLLLNTSVHFCTPRNMSQLTDISGNTLGFYFRQDAHMHNALFKTYWANLSKTLDFPFCAALNHDCNSEIVPQTRRGAQPVNTPMVKHRNRFNFEFFWRTPVLWYGNSGNLLNSDDECAAIISTTQNMSFLPFYSGTYNYGRVPSQEQASRYMFGDNRNREHRGWGTATSWATGAVSFANSWYDIRYQAGGYIWIMEALRTQENLISQFANIPARNIVSEIKKLYLPTDGDAVSRVMQVKHDCFMNKMPKNLEQAKKIIDNTITPDILFGFYAAEYFMKRLVLALERERVHRYSMGARAARQFMLNVGGYNVDVRNNAFNKFVFRYNSPLSPMHDEYQNIRGGPALVVEPDEEDTTTIQKHHTTRNIDA